jgi:hypothetical protein
MFLTVYPIDTERIAMEPPLILSRDNFEAEFNQFCSIYNPLQAVLVVGFRGGIGGVWLFQPERKKTLGIRGILCTLGVQKAKKLLVRAF